MAYRILTAAALAVALAAPALAQEIRPAGPPIVLKLSAGTLIQTASPLGNVFVADPEIASAIPAEGAAGKNLIHVFAKAPGKTTLFALSEDGNIMLSRAVEVPEPRTLTIMRGSKTEVISLDPQPRRPTLDDLPAGSIVAVPVGRR